MTLADNIERLATEHQVVARIEEQIQFHAMPALLESLREAVFGGMERGGGATSGEAKLPIDAAALDLYQAIDRQIAEAWAGTFRKPPIADKPETLLIEWGRTVNPDTNVTLKRDGRERDYTAETLTAKWVQQVTEFFDPRRTAEINAPCPTCGERWVQKTRDGETVNATALVFVRELATGESIYAECQACTSIWGKAKFLDFAKGIAAAEKEEARIAEET